MKKLVFIAVAAAMVVGFLYGLRQVDESVAPAPIQVLKQLGTRLGLPVARPLEIVEDFSKWPLDDVEKEIKRIDDEYLTLEMFDKLNDNSATPEERSRVEAAFHRKNALWSRQMELKLHDVNEKVDELQRQHPNSVDDLRRELEDEV